MDDAFEFKDDVEYMLTFAVPENLKVHGKAYIATNLFLVVHNIGNIGNYIIIVLGSYGRTIGIYLPCP